jgi:hypothetical protein
VRPLDGLQQPFFFLFRPATSYLFDRAEPADLFVDDDQLVPEVLEPMELVDLILGFAQRGWVGKCLGYCFAFHSSSEAEVGIMAGVIGFGAMAGRFAAAADDGGNRARPKIAQPEELLQELGTVGFQRSECNRHVHLLLYVYIRTELRHKKRKTASRHFWVAYPPACARRSRTQLKMF